MKFSILLTASAFVATTFAGPNLFARGTADCRFVADVYSAYTTSGYRRCRMDAALPAEKCPKIASVFTDPTSTFSCRIFSDRKCTELKGLGVQGQSCSGSYLTMPKQNPDESMLKALKNCLVELKPEKDLKMWKSGCETVKTRK
ncbi:hypothetical protein BG000_004400 [Podila horticola]|nr:hypothetical protein BG000_004400 [Podila horticola]